MPKNPSRISLLCFNFFVENLLFPNFKKNHFQQFRLVEQSHILSDSLASDQAIAGWDPCSLARIRLEAAFLQPDWYANKDFIW